MARANTNIAPSGFPPSTQPHLLPSALLAMTLENTPPEDRLAQARSRANAIYAQHRAIQERMRRDAGPYLQHAGHQPLNNRRGRGLFLPSTSGSRRRGLGGHGGRMGQARITPSQQPGAMRQRVRKIITNCVASEIDDLTDGCACERCKAYRAYLKSTDEKEAAKVEEALSRDDSGLTQEMEKMALADGDTNTEGTGGAHAPTTDDQARVNVWALVMGVMSCRRERAGMATITEENENEDKDMVDRA
ncbi:hypothetical protein EK21DRAFT_116132 [Setomelanomma holmii]|uniref:Uncharacterized protein n=1 Tax=Setomelanomma holmii TaxID=210430 RepID=A0A9P4H0E7_9PLEO|nr:hypothetical protein EK21DRAFT_116132 [Setomelanomma holmii]